jgi:hypothetical protein
MYADPKHIRNNRVNISITDTERRALEAIAELNGVQPSVFVRELMMGFLRGHVINSDSQPGELKQAH